MRTMMRNKLKFIPVTNLGELAGDLRKLRKEKNLSTAEVEKAAEVSRRTIVNAEAGKNVGIREFSRMLDAMGYELVIRPKKTVVFEELEERYKQ